MRRLVEPKHLGLVLAFLVVGCVEIGRYQYISFERTPGAEITRMGEVEAKNAMGGSQVPTEYTIQRKSYTLRITVDTAGIEPKASIEIVDAQNVYLRPAPSRGVRRGRPRSCGAYEAATDSVHPREFEFTWVLCGSDVDPGEFLVAFDVVDEAGGSVQEDLPFEMRTTGFYWIKDDL